MTTVLVVDDDPDIRQLVVELLRLSGMEAGSLASGVALLESLASAAPSERPDVLLLDVQMPALDGWDTLRAIRSQPDLATLRVVLCTVKAAPEDIAMGTTLGCDGYLAKPFSVAELVAEIERVCALPSRESASTGGPHPL